MRKQRETILLVDDEYPDRQVMADALERNGYNVLKASGYTEAMAAARAYTSRIHLLICDVSLPQSNAFELYEELCRFEQREIKALFVSGYPGALLCRFHGLPLEDLHFLSKPFEARELLARVRRVLQTPEQIRAPLHHADVMLREKAS